MESQPEFVRQIVREFIAADKLLSSLLKLHKDEASTKQATLTKTAQTASQAATGYMDAIQTNAAHKKGLPSPSHSEIKIAPQIDTDIVELKRLSAVAESQREELNLANSRMGALKQQLQAQLLKEQSDRQKRNIRIVLFATALGCIVVALHFWLLERTTLSFKLSLDGKDFPTELNSTVTVDGKAFVSGSKIDLGSHQIAITFPGGEIFNQRVWFFYGRTDLGIVPLESSKGSLSVTVTPSPAKVIVRRNGKIIDQGDAPFKMEKLPVGDYTMLIQRGDYQESTPVKIERQQRCETNIELSLGRAQLVSEPPEANYDLSGNGMHWQGKLPATVDDMPSGIYSLIVTRGGWNQSTNISILRGMTTTNKTEFLYGAIELTSEPKSLPISTNGVEIGKTPIILHELRPGQYSVAASDGENDLTVDISVSPNEIAKHLFVFRYGNVQIDSVPPGATVIRKEKILGKTPLTIPHIPAGDMAVELQLHDYVTTNLSVHAVEDITTHISTKLVSERYVQAIKQARGALADGQLDDSHRFIAAALESNPDDIGAQNLRDEISAAEKKTADAHIQAEKDKVIAIIEKAIAAQGGRNALMRSLASKQVATSGGKLKDGNPFSARITTYTQSPDKIRMDEDIRYKPKTLLGSLASVGFNVSVNGQAPDQEKVVRAIHCVAGHEAWDLTDGKRHAMSRKLEQELRNGFYFSQCVRLVPLLDEDFHFEMLAISSHSPKYSIGIKVQKTGKPDLTLYFNDDSGLISGIEFKEPDSNSDREILVTILYSDFRSFSGVMLPTRLEFDHDGKYSGSERIENIELYESLPDSTFLPPKN